MRLKTKSKAIFKMLPKKPSLPKMPAPTTSVKSPMKMGSTAVKMPKTKTLAGPTDKPSLFFKNEEIDPIKHASVRKLRDFLVSVKARTNLK